MPTNFRRSLNLRRSLSAAQIWCALSTLFAAVFLLSAAVTSMAADIPRQPQRVIAAPIPPVTVKPGKPSSVELDFRIAPGLHINSNQPKSALLVPTVVRFEPPTDIVVGKVTYPRGQDMTVEFLPDEKLNVYTGDFTVTALVSTARTMSPGTYRVRATLKYQACDNRQCFPPTQLPVDFDVKVRKASAARRRGNPGQSPHVHR